jgi:hypothetical protein
MDYPTFQRVLESFADRPADIDIKKGTVVLAIRNELIEASISHRAGELIVTENGQQWPAGQWICQRIAQLPLLADRIIELVDEEKDFVSPKGQILYDINESPEEMLVELNEIPQKLIDSLDQKPAGVTTVVYLTSDAGEGKTTLINHTARLQAALYKQKKVDWLLLPVSLGGRTFMRFDDVIVGTLMNRLRFNVLFYDSFVELMRLGAIVPALDGFEEMFVEGSSGDAISALGNLMQALQSSGGAVIAARKAYFQYKSLRAQTRLLDSMSGQSVSFSRIGICRWDKDQFLAYASKRGVEDSEGIYAQISNQLGSDHPLLTRAVLVERLLDIADEGELRLNLLEQIKVDPSDYFRQFIGSIIHREATRKWIDKSGEPAQPLLSVDEHYELLAELALEMWTTGTDKLPQDVISFIAEIFADSHKKNRVITQQIIERIKQHALIVTGDGGKYGFDHEEFYHFFLGEAIGKIMARKDISLLRRALSQAVLPQLSQEAAARYVQRRGILRGDFNKIVNDTFAGEPRISLTKENLCGLCIHVLHIVKEGGIAIVDGAFPADSLNGKEVIDVDFRRCYFQKSSFFGTTLRNCHFIECEFDGLECDNSTLLSNVTLQDCRVGWFSLSADVLAEYVPERIVSLMRQRGFELNRIMSEGVRADAAPIEPDAKVQIMERVLRTFMRATGVNENTFRKRLGPQASVFLDDMLPDLELRGILVEVAFRGKGIQKRYRLGTSFDRLADSIESCGGQYDRFLELAGNQP